MAASLAAIAQTTQVDPTQLKRQIKTGATLPATCTTGDLFFKTDAQPGSNIYGCTAGNTWTATGAQAISSDGFRAGVEPAINFVTGTGLMNAVVDTGSQINVEIGMDTAIVQTQSGEQSGTTLFCNSLTGSSSEYQCALNPTASGYTAGMVLHWHPDVSGAGGSTTLNVDQLGARRLKRADGASDPAPGDIVAGQLYDLWYDGVTFRFMLGNNSGGGNGGSNGLATVATSGSYNDLINKPVIPSIPAVTSMLKGSGTGGVMAAVPGTDFAPATPGSSVLKADGSGGFASAVAGTDFAPASHGLLSGTHSDSVPGTPVPGGLLYVNPTSRWAQLPGNSSTTKEFLAQTGTGTASAAPVWTQLAVSDITGLAASATVDTTNATNIVSGTLAAGRLPVFTGDVVTPGGTAVTTVSGINGAPVPAGVALLATNSAGQLIAQAGTIANSTTGNAKTATQLAATPTQCPAGNFPSGVDASGNAQNCTPASGAAVTQSYVNAVIASINASTTTYASIAGNMTWNTAESNRAFSVGRAGTVTGISVYLAGAQSGTGSLTFVLRKNSANTSCVLTITAGSAIGTYSANCSASFAPADVLSWQATNAATVNSALVMDIVILYQ